MLRFIKTLLLTVAAILFGTFLTIIIIVAAVAAFVAPNMSETISVSKNSVLEINMNEYIVDSPRPQDIKDILGLSVMTTEVTLFDMLRAIESAATDDNIKAISIRMDGSQGMSLVAASQLRSALARMREESDKPIYAYAEDYSQIEYYVATVADSIFIHPLGSIEWRGVAMTSLYYGDMLDKLEIDVEVFRPEECIYKSAVEPYTRSNMSTESRSQSKRIVDQLWSTVLKDVAASLDISVTELRRIAQDEIVLDSQEALKHKMVNHIGQLSDYEATLKRAEVKFKNQRPQTISLAKYATLTQSIALESESDSDNQIAIIYADGVIGVGEDDYQGINATRLTRLLRKAANDDSIKGVVLRINSPGGGALESDVIAHEVRQLTKKKFVVVSMGSAAASGGYYISAPADVIFADQFTITGSIGVYGLMLNLEEAAQKHLHINSDGVASSPSADFGSPFRAINQSERRAIMRGVDNVYTEFKRVVSRGRDLPMQRVDTLSQGRVWCCTDAINGGLVDYAGGFDSALSYTKEQLDNNKPITFIELVDEPDGWKHIFSSLSGGISSMLLNQLGIGGKVIDSEKIFSGDLNHLFNIESGIISHSPLTVTM